MKAYKLHYYIYSAFFGLLCLNVLASTLSTGECTYKDSSGNKKFKWCIDDNTRKNYTSFGVAQNILLDKDFILQSAYGNSGTVGLWDVTLWKQKNIYVWKFRFNGNEKEVFVTHSCVSYPLIITNIIPITCEDWSKKN